VLGFGVVLAELARVTAAARVIFVRLLATLGAFFTALSAFLAAVFGFFLARAFRATVRAFGAA